MAEELSPDTVLAQLGKGRMAPYYLFYGPSEFLIERVLDKIRKTFIPESVRDFNLLVFYGEKKGTNVVSQILDSARSMPFLAENRLIVVRRTEDFSASDLEGFIPYLENPVASTCLIFLASKTNFKLKFFQKIKNLGAAVSFNNLYDNKVGPWIKKTAHEIGFNIEEKACVYLFDVVGNNLMELYSELEKIFLCFGKANVTLENVKSLAVHSRVYSVFEFIDAVSEKKCFRSLEILNIYLEEEGPDASLGLLGMINRQVRLMYQAKSIINAGGSIADISQNMNMQGYVAKKIFQQIKAWRMDELVHAFELLAKTDERLKSGSPGHLVLENLVLSLCGPIKDNICQQSV